MYTDLNILYSMSYTGPIWKGYTDPRDVMLEGFWEAYHDINYMTPIDRSREGWADGVRSRCSRQGWMTGPTPTLNLDSLPWIVEYITNHTDGLEMDS